MTLIGFFWIVLLISLTHEIGTTIVGALSSYNRVIDKIVDVTMIVALGSSILILVMSLITVANDAA